MFSTTFGSGARVIDAVTGTTKWNWSAFRTIADTGTSAKVTDILSPLDKRTTIKYALSKIANVYSTLGGDSVPVSERSSNPSGQTLFVELSTILTRANPVVANGIIQVPVQSRIELRVPNDGELTDDVIEEFMSATFDALKNGDGELVITAEKLRGALVPSGI